MADASRDGNRVTTLMGVSDADGTTPLPVKIDATTGRILCSATGVGTGDVVGPAVAVANNVAIFNGTTGKIIKDSGLALSGSNTGDQDLSGLLTKADNLASVASSTTSFDNISPTTTKGDVITSDGSNNIRLAVGADGLVLTAQADGSVAWEAAPAGGDVSKVGTPADNQVGVWTGDGTIEGTVGLTYDGSNFQLTGDIGATATRITKIWATDLEVTNAIVGSITGQSATVATITGLAPDTATTQATQANITTCANLVSVGALDSGSITSGFTSIDVGAGAIDGGVITADTNFAGALTGNVTGNCSGSAGTVATITGLAPDTATTQATQASITTCANLVSVGALASGSIASGFGTINIGTSNAVSCGTVQLGHASDTTLSRSAAGVLAVEGVVIPSISSTNTLTNKSITPRVLTFTTDATPEVNSDSYDAVTITAQDAAITDVDMVGSAEVNFQKIIFRIKDDGTARAITWGSDFEDAGKALPTTTVISKLLTVGFIYNTVTAKWGCVAVGSET